MSPDHKEIQPCYPEIFRASLLFSGFAAIFFCFAYTLEPVWKGSKPAGWFLAFFEVFSLAFFFFILKPDQENNQISDRFKARLYKGFYIAAGAGILIPFFIMSFTTILNLITDSNPLASLPDGFGPEKSVLFIAALTMMSGSFSTLLFSGLFHLKNFQQVSDGRSFDVFFSFSKMNLGEGMPADDFLYNNLFRQIRKADQLGFKKAWIGEAHFSIKTEQHKPEPLLPHFKGELCINTDILQIAPLVNSITEKIEIGSAIRNILVNGGPVAHAEAIRTFLTLHQHHLKSSGRKIQIGFGVGRFAYANEVYGIKPRNEAEKILWPAIRGLVLRQATEIFLRLLKGEILGSADVSKSFLYRKSIRNMEDWDQAMYYLNLGTDCEEIIIPPFWDFQPVKIIPEDCDLSCLELTLGSHDPELQIFANQFLPVKVFNLSVTPGEVIDSTHERMAAHFHPDGGPWKREYMPRTIMIFTCADKKLSREEQDQKAFEEARAAMVAYWQAMEGTVDQTKVEGGMENAVYGSPEKVKRMLEEKFHPQDRLMTWFDFNTNDADLVMKRMQDFMVHVKPLFNA